MDSTPKILILDDEANQCKILSDILRLNGFYPIPVRLGKEAVEWLKREEIDVAIIDLQLEDISGLEALRRIKAESPSTECILFTGHASSESAIEALNLGAYSYFQKPFDLNQLLLSLRHAIEKRATHKALLESQILHRTFLDAASDMVFLKDEQFRYLLVNKTNARFFGKPVEEIIGKDDFDLMPSEAAASCRASDQKALEANDTVITLEEVNGHIYETLKFPVPLANGKVGVGGYVRDVTDKIRAEERLRLQSIALEASANAIVITDQQAVIQWANPAFSRLTGYSLEEIIGKNPRDLVKSGVQGPEFYAALWQTILSGHVWQGTLVNRRKNGTLYDEEMTITPFLADKGQPKYFIAIKQDITERKQAEKALRDSERRYQTLAELSPVGIFHTDASGQTIYVNPRWCEIAGMSPDAALGNGWLERVHPDDRRRLSEEWERKVNEQSLSTAEYRFLKPDGSVAWVLGQAAPERDSEGHLLGYVGVIVDITERKQAEQALAASEERYRLLAENMSDIVWLMDLNLKVTYISPSVTKVRGYTLEELNELPLERQLAPGSLTKALRALSGVLSSEALHKPDESIVRNLELEFYRKDGPSFWSETTFSLIRNPDGSPRAILAVGRDVTERKKAQEALEYSEKRFRALIENSSDIIILLDSRGNELYHSPSFWKITGRTSQERLGRNFFEQIHPEDQPEISRLFNEILAHYGESRNIRFRCCLEKDRVRWLEGTATNLLGEPAVQSIVINLRDVTERVLAEQDLAAHLNELQMLYEHGLTINGLLDVEEICKQLIRRIETRLQWHHLSVRLVDPNTNEVHVVAFSQPGVSDAEQAAYIAHLNKKINRPGKGMTGWVIKHGEPICSKDVTQDKRYLETFPGIRSGLYVPLKTGQKTIGAISVESENYNAFDEHDQQLLMTLATQAAIAIENARLYEKAIHNARRDSALHEAILEMVNAAYDLQGIYAAIHHAVERVMPCQAFSIVLMDKLGVIPRTVYFAQKDKSETTARIYPLEVMNKHASRITKPLRIANLKREKNLPVPADELHPCSYLAVPLIRDNKILGIVSTISAVPDQYSAEDQSFLETLAAEAVIALENARLFRETQKRLRYISALHNVDVAISTSMDLRVTLSIILDEIIRELKIDAAAVLLFNPAVQALEYSASKGFRAYLVEGIRVRFGEGLAGQAALQRKLLALHELPRDTPDVFKSEHFAVQFAIPLIAKGQIQGVLHLCYRDSFEPDGDWTSFLSTLAGQLAIAIDNAHLFINLQRTNLELMMAYDATIQGWSNALDLRDQETEGHSQRVTELTLELATAIGVPESALEHIRRGALLHDIGKIAIPDSILRKPDRLTDEEWEIMRRHPIYAYELLSPIEYLHPAIDIPYCHHERWDGTGYPRGLKGEQIPLAARIFAVADVWDALTSNRPYRKAWTKAEALKYIREQAGKLFDPAVVEAFLKLQSIW